MNLRAFKALTFDCYGTLIDWEGGILAELKPWVSASGHKLTDDQILEAFGETESACELATPSKLYPGILADTFRALAKHWSISASDAQAAEFGRSVPRWPAFPDSAAALQYLKQHYKLVILSNVDRASFAESNKKLQVTFDKIVTAQDVGSYKPNLGNFRQLLAEVGKLGIRKEQILHTAQSLFHDVAPAKSQGLKTCWINRRKGRPGGGATKAPTGDATPDIEFPSMAALVETHRKQAQGG
ncbi:MAG TPA: haloacid dehalogenase type II [Stellaceae bacterium]|nr:haloacid dehalogenase type II [Stellaceae bacterium]